MCKWFDGLATILRVILLLPRWGWVFSGLYRIFAFAGSKYKNVWTLVLGICCLFPLVGFVVSIIDLVTTIAKDKISVQAN